MIDPWLRFWASSSILRFHGPQTWHITDFDQRRVFSVTYHSPVPIAQEEAEETEEICTAKLKKHLDDLGEGVYGFSFSHLEGPITITTDPKDDETFYVNNHPLSSLGLSYPVKTIYMSSLTELDRLGPDVDLVSYQEGARGGTTTAAFKYWWLPNGFRNWTELNDWIRQPRHPHIVPFDAVVLDDVRGGIVGFTSIFIPGGTLKQTARTRTFRLKWLHQLLEVVDTLNYEYGLMHQDIAVRNIVVDPETDNLRIFDFDLCCMMAHLDDSEKEDVHGVVATLYEIITLDEQTGNALLVGQKDPEDIVKKEWTKHPDVSLDSSVQAFKDVLGEWMARRKGKPFTPRSTWIEWPAMPQHPLVPTRALGVGRKTEVKMESVSCINRQHYVEMGEPFYNWERPLSYKLREAEERDQGEASIEAPEQKRRRFA